MAVKIVPKFTRSDIEKMLADRYLRIDQALVLRLKRIGETFVKNARENATFTDRTGNLRNSIGYVVLRDGVQMDADFKRSANVSANDKKSKGSKDGVNAAKDLAAEISRNFPRGYVLIVVAGMEYAAAVESKGLDVLTASSVIAKNDLKRAIKELSSKISRMK